jgi:hypothetical protein
MSSQEAPDNNSKQEAERPQIAEQQRQARQDDNNKWNLVADRSRARTRAMQQRKASTAADRQGGDRARASASDEEPDKTTSSTTQRDDQASQASSASARSAANKDKGGNGDMSRSKGQQGHQPSSSSARQQQPQRELQQAKAQPGDIVRVDLDEEEANDTNDADVSDQGGTWIPVRQRRSRWRRQTLTHRLSSSSVGGNLNERTEHEADEAESQPAKASKASQHDGGEKSTGSGAGARRQRRNVEPQGDAGRGPRAKPKSK